MYRKFQILRIYKFHESLFFKTLQNIEKSNINWNNMKSFYKNRPAIVLRVFKSKTNLDSNAGYLVAPLTSKRSIENWYGTRTSLRILFKNKYFKYKRSYIMLDNIMFITEEQIKGIYNPNKNIINLTGGQIRFLKQQISNKLGHLLESYNYIESLEINGLEEKQKM